MRRAPPRAGHEETMAARTLAELVRLVENPYQQDAIDRVLYASKESARIYLQGYAKNEARRGKTANLEGIFTLLGTMRNGVREEYQVRFYAHGSNAKGSFWCSCPGHKFNAAKRNMVCKHIVFVVCRVAKILDPAFFATKHLTAEQHAHMLAVAENTDGLLQDLTIAAPTEGVTHAAFRARVRAIGEDDACPICYEELLPPEGAAPTAELLSCPACKNYVHDECMRVWLERKDTCVMCRSDVWRAFRG